MAPEGENLKEHIEKKYGKGAGASFGDPNGRLAQMGRKVGIEFHTERRMVNTVRAHALVEAVKDTISNDMANKLMEHLYELYFVQGKDISNNDILLQAAQTVAGMDPKDAAMAMETGADDVHQKDRSVKAGWGVSGVPFYVIEQPNNNNNPQQAKPPVSFSGAYPPNMIAEELQKAAGVK